MLVDKKTEQGEECNSLAAWEMVCKPKNHGGLGVINLRIQSDALLLKYLHKFYNYWDLPSVELIWNTYYTMKIPHATDCCGSFWWRDIYKLMLIYRGITKLTMARGTTTVFWEDLCLDDVLAETHLHALSFVRNEDILVKDFLSTTSLGETFPVPLSTQAHAEAREIQ